MNISKKIVLFSWITSLVIPIVLTLLFIGCSTKIPAEKAENIRLNSENVVKEIGTNKTNDF